MDATLMLMVLFGLLGCLLLAVVAARLIFAPETVQDRKRAARLRALRPEGAGAEAAAIVKSSARTSGGRILPIVGDLPLLLRRANLEGRGMVLALAAGVGGVVLAAGATLILPLPLALPAGLVTSAAIVLWIIKRRHAKRMELLTAQLPDALDLMMRGLRVGHPVNATIANVGRTMADPVGSEFRLLSDQISHGDYLADAFRDFAERTGQEDVEYLSVSISIQHGTGGNLADMLGTLSRVVRDRIIMRRKVRAISSEGRMSAYVLSGLPVLIYLATSLTSPEYYGDVSGDPLYAPIAWIIVALVIGNFLALRKLVSFRI